jgi:hypothetical protein
MRGIDAVDQYSARLAAMPTLYLYSVAGAAHRPSAASPLAESTACRAFEPTINITQQDTARIRRRSAEFAGTARPCLHQRGAGKRALPIRGHDRLTHESAERWIAQPARMFTQ